MFARMVGATIGRIDAMIGGKKDGVVWSHGLLHLSEPAIYIAQCLGVPFTIATMSPQHIKFYQIDKEQASKIMFKPTQCCCHTVTIGFGMVALGQPTSGEEVFNFPDADDIFATSFSRSSSVMPSGASEKSRRCSVRLKLPGVPINGRAMTRPTAWSPVSILRAISHIWYSSVKWNNILVRGNLKDAIGRGIEDGVSRCACVLRPIP